MNTVLLEKLKNIVSEDRLLLNESMSSHTSFKIGGPAEIFISVENACELKQVISCVKECAVPYIVIGNGSNLLVGDKGVKGVVIAVKKQNYEFKPDKVENDEAVITVYAGDSLSAFAKAAAAHGYTGTEPLAGIPGSVGGAVAMNAGAYGGEIKDIIISADVIDENGELKTLSASELELEYRNSAVLKKGYIVACATFKLKKGDADESLAMIADFNKRRRDKQPLEYPSAGSTFKRPEGYFAGKLIEDSGLKGYTHGGCMVSEKHCGFVINHDHATASDVISLIEEVKNIVFEKTGVTMEPEVRMIGEF